MKRTSRVPWTSRVAGVLVALLGVANATFGVLALATDLVRLTTPTAFALLVLGALTVAISIPVWRGSRPAVTAALTLFVLLLIMQLGNLVPSSDTQSPAAPLVVLGIVVVALGVARWHLWRAARR